MDTSKYRLGLVLWVVAYAVLLVVSIEVLDRNVVTGLPFRVVVALIPMLPAFGILVITMQTYRRSDELERKIVAEGIMFAFGSTAIITFSYGFLQRFVGAPDVSYFCVWPILGATWLIGTQLARYRYR